MCLIFLEKFWVVHIPFVRRVKFKLLAYFPVDHLTHQVMSSLILSLQVIDLIISGLILSL